MKIICEKCNKKGECEFVPYSTECDNNFNDNKKNEYEVSIVVSGRYHTTVKANSPEEAKEIANHIFEEADIGDIECVDWKVQHAEGSDGSWTDFV